MEKAEHHYIVLDLLELARPTPRNWCSATSVETYLNKHAEFQRYCEGREPNALDSAAGV